MREPSIEPKEGRKGCPWFKAQNKILNPYLDINRRNFRKVTASSLFLSTSIPILLPIATTNQAPSRQTKESGTEVLASQLFLDCRVKTQWLSGLYYADFISFYSPYSTVDGDDEIEF